MTIKKIVTFGCSWTYGDELQDPTSNIDVDEYRMKHVWGNLIAEHHGWKFENHGYPGASLTSIRDSITWYVATQDITDVIFLVGLTEPNRQSWYNNKHEKNDIDPSWMNHVHSNWVIDNESSYSKLWQHAFKSFLLDQQCKEWMVSNFNQTVMLIDGIAARYNIPVVQFNMLNEVLDGITPKSLYWPEYNMGEYLDEHYIRGDKVWAPQGHPNELGHKIISKKLISHIDSAILCK